MPFSTQSQEVPHRPQGRVGCQHPRPSREGRFPACTPLPSDSGGSGLSCTPCRCLLPARAGAGGKSTPQIHTRAPRPGSLGGQGGHEPAQRPQGKDGHRPPGRRRREGILPLCSLLVGHIQALGPVLAPQ